MVSRQRRLLSFAAEDGFVINALLVSGEFDREEDLYEAPIVLLVHGVLGHFLARGTPRQLPNAFVENGISSFSINTRMAFTGQMFGSAIFDESIMDIEAGVDALVKEGFKNIFILGWSLGANISVYYSVNNQHPNVKGLILEGCSSSLPKSNEMRLKKWNSVPSYDHIYQIAKDVLKPDPVTTQNDRVFIVYRAWGPTFDPGDVELFTYRTWWFMRSPEAYNAKTNEIIQNVKVPVLFIHGENDYTVGPEEVKSLLKIMKDSGHENVELVFVPDARHDCMENPNFTVDTLVKWLKSF
ncbi:MAG: prolyl oligopeptidase family serine peptidase [Thermodesulfobacteriota bacterium]